MYIIVVNKSQEFLLNVRRLFAIFSTTTQGNRLSFFRRRRTPWTLDAGKNRRNVPAWKISEIVKSSLYWQVCVMSWQLRVLQVGSWVRSCVKRRRSYKAWRWARQSAPSLLSHSTGDATSPITSANALISFSKRCPWAFLNMQTMDCRAQLTSGELSGAEGHLDRSFFLLFKMHAFDRQTDRQTDTF